MQKPFEKRHIFSALLKKSSVFVHINGRIVGGGIPAFLRLQDQVILQFGLDMPVPIPDLNWDDYCVMGTLSFKGVPYFCEVPWSAVYAIVGEDAKGMVFEEDMPQSVRDEADRNRKKKEDLVKESPSPLKLVTNPNKLKEMPSVRNVTKHKVFKRSERPDYLRLVK